MKLMTDTQALFHEDARKAGNKYLQKSKQMDTRTQYFIVGRRPVYMKRRNDGRVLNSFKFSWDNGEFVDDDEYWLKIIFGRIDEIDEVSEKEFWEQVQALRKKKGFA